MNDKFINFLKSTFLVLVLSTLGASGAYLLNINFWHELDLRKNLNVNPRAVCLKDFN